MGKRLKSTGIVLSFNFFFSYSCHDFSFLFFVYELLLLFLCLEFKPLQL